MPSLWRLLALATMLVCGQIFVSHIVPCNSHSYPSLDLDGSAPPAPEDSPETVAAFAKRNVFTDRMSEVSLHDFASRESGGIVVESSSDCYNAGGMLDRDMDRWFLFIILFLAI